MKIKRYTAPDMRKALIMVRDELGPDAVILSNRKVPEGIEITVAKDYEPGQAPGAAPQEMLSQQPAPASHSQPANFESQLRQQSQAINPGREDSYLAQQLAASNEVSSGNGLPGNGLPANVQANKEIARLNLEMEKLHKDLQNQRSLNQRLEQERIRLQSEQERFDEHNRSQAYAHEHQIRDAAAMEMLRDEVGLLKDMLRQRLDGTDWDHLNVREPIRASIFKRLREMGISPTLSRKLVDQKQLPEDLKPAWRQILAQLSRHLPIFHSSRRKDGPRIIALVGPTGSGKTTTIAKLASQYVLDYGSENLGLVTTDSYRIGAHEQLRVLGKILEVPIRIANGKNTLNQMIKQLQHKDLILIDTAGIRSGNPEWEEQLAQLNQLNYPVEAFLMLPCTQQHRVLETTVRDYKALQLKGCVLSKLDETQSLGESLSVVIENRLPIAYITDGQNIPQDIHQPKAHSLISKAVALSGEVESDPEMMPYEYADGRSGMQNSDNDYARIA